MFCVWRAYTCKVEDLKMIVKLHKMKNGRILVALCDKELLGKKFEEGNKCLDVTVEFYGGEELDAVEVGDLVRNADYVNAVGTRAIELCVHEDVIEKENVITIAGVPHAQSILEN